MNDSRDLNADHPLWLELRNGLLWHRTSPAEYRQILAEGFIKPNDGRINRWGGKYACQQLGGISLFDFTTQSESLVLGEYIKWRQFLGDARPVTVLMGFDRNKLPGRLIPYPENKNGTTGNVIPYVEICHCGSIPVAAIVAHLLICSGDYGLFRKVGVLDDQTLAEAEAAFAPIVSQQNRQHAAMVEKMNAILQSPEAKARLEQARRAIAKMEGRE